MIDANGRIARPKLLAAYERICGPVCRWYGSRTDQVRAAEAFLRMIQGQAKLNGISNDEQCERLGY